VKLYKNCSNYIPGVKIGLAPGVIDFPYTFIYIEKFLKSFFSELTNAGG
jgi:hypothetical protein